MGLFSKYLISLCWALVFLVPLANASEDSVGPADIALFLPENSYAEIFDCLLATHRELQIYSSLAEGKIEMPENMTPAGVISGLKVKQLFARSWALRLTTASLDTPVEGDDPWDTLLWKLRSSDLTNEQKTDAEIERQESCALYMTKALEKAAN